MTGSDLEAFDHESHMREAFALAREATERAETVLDTSTEPCPMCASGMRTAGFGWVVYSVSGDDIAGFTGGEPSARGAAILGEGADVVGPVLNDEGRAVHEAFDW
jgi:tRNA(Arg) A34 adenosine deaminase TadA